MKPAIALVAASLFLLAPLPGAAADDVEASDEPPRVARQESLELPGLTACHQCEWRPKPHTKAAADECGITSDGQPRLGLFECGFSQECDRVCNFVRCSD
jgi:hypothetical protein